MTELPCVFKGAFLQHEGSLGGEAVLNLDCSELRIDKIAKKCTHTCINTHVCECKTNNVWIRSVIASCQVPGSDSVLWLRKMLHWGKLGEECMAPLSNVFCNFL